MNKVYESLPGFRFFSPKLCFQMYDRFNIFNSEKVEKILRI